MMPTTVHDEPFIPDSVPPASAVVFPGVAAILPALALGACGDGGSAPGGATSVTPTPTPTAALPTATEASRFLAQASMGGSRADIDSLAASGFDTWLTTQFAMPRATSLWDWLVAAGYNATTNINTTNGFNNAVWSQLITGQDTLRQRVGLSLLDMLVVSIDGLNTNWRTFAAAAYLDVLWDGAFGNYRDLLDKITTNAAMAYWLTFINNRKASAATGAQPDENYARELMQLFTIGLYNLKDDGSQQLVSGKPVESYTQDDVSGLARVFTGFVLDSVDSTTPDRLRRPLVQKAGDHETAASTFLGTTVPAGTDGFGAAKIALDAIFAHQNLPPFVSKQLIQRLVTSNPSPGYTGRVVAVFKNNGSGVRGDLKAVVRAILTDTEARGTVRLNDPDFGKLREPVVRLTNWARAFGVTSPSGAWAIGDTSSAVNRLAQGVGHSPSVFNFFRPGYSPPNSALSAAGLVAPEFQITSEPTIVAYVNYMQMLIQSGTGDVKADYTAILAKAADSAALTGELNTVLASGQLSSTTLATIRTAVDTIATTSPALLLNRVQTAILLTMASPDYIAQK